MFRPTAKTSRSGVCRAILALGLTLGLVLGGTLCANAWSGASAEPVVASHAVARHSQVELVAERTTLQPGQAFPVALRMELAEGWHTYWQHAGDSGLPLRLEWQLPAGFTAGPIQWPKPEAIPMPPYLNYGYHGQVAMLVNIQPPDDLASGTRVTLTARAKWLVCKEVCLPEEADVTLLAPVAEHGERNPAWADLFDQTRARLPKPWPENAPTATTDGAEIRLLFEEPGKRAEGSPLGDDTFFFAADDGVIEHAAAQQWQRFPGGDSLTLKSSPFATGPLSRLRGVLSDQAARAEAPAWTIDVPMASVGTAAAAPSPAAIPVPTPDAFPTGTQPGFLLALGLAFAGGLLLNLMPCVFPMLSIKVLSFVGKASGNSGHLRLHGWLFAAGVLLSFWALLAVLLVLKGLGEQLGWGFQLQSPWFVALLSLLMFGIGLNLLGIFESGLGLATASGNTDPGRGFAGSFFTGILTTLVASPCTAPFMGAALGYAFSQTAAVSTAVFTALGLGMSAPYLLLLETPALLRRLPKPGPWMDILKQVLAFPMFLSAVWLLWVLGRQNGVDAVAIVLLALVGLAALAWYYGRKQRRGRVTANVLASCLLLAGATVAATLGSLAAVGESRPTTDVAEWLPFSQQRLTELRSQQENVFVDFTAAWCITCQVNKRVALQNDAVLEKFRQHRVVRMRADWTNRSPEITHALAGFGRSGVPLNVYYPANGEPRVLPALLSPGMVIGAIEGAR